MHLLVQKKLAHLTELSACLASVRLLPLVLAKPVLALLIAGRLAVTASLGRATVLGGITQYSNGSPSK